MRIAIVNDLSLATEVLKRLVASAPGCSVAWTAADGAEAVRKACADRPDVILMDLVMPVMDGVEATRRIKQDPALKAIPVVIVSYKDREEDRMWGLDAGANCYLTKSSFHDNTFLRAVADLIGEA